MLYYIGWIWIFLFVLLSRVIDSGNMFSSKAYFIITVLQVLALGLFQAYFKGLRIKDWVLTGILLAGLYVEMKWVFEHVKAMF
ncbi:hypothetical protein [Paenibacillus sp. RC67]|uniref:hypothetical protein n=1 Tax=Paenibacillus sp. RC67 TaxID=3039392 RepID=UPI0024AD033C|nr:hypothetical protein [Paenibacillus sp. RC67]